MSNSIYTVGYDSRLRELPDGYTQLEYIESSGTQFIDTGFTPNYQSACELTMEYAAVVTANVNCGLFGGSGASRNVTAFECFYQSSTMYYSFGTGYDVSTSLSVNEKFTMKISQSEAKMTKNGTTVFSATPSASTFTSPSTFIIFGLNREGNASYLSSSRCYSCKLWDNGNLVRDLIPCINAANEIGLYDLVNEVFYGNSGTGVFIAGNIISSSPVAKQVQNNYVVSWELPENYTRLDYIESSGTQYIDMGFKATSSTRITLDCDITYGSSWIMILGSYDSGAYYSWWGNGSNLQPYYGSSNKSAPGPTGRTLLFSSEAIWLAGGDALVFAASTFTATSNAYLFSISNGGSYTKASMKVYGCVVVENGTFIRNFIPCINSNNEIGLYDLVNSTFYGNNGTGTFIAGSETENKIVTKRIKKGYIVQENFEIANLPEGYTQVEYIESSGTQYIDTGFSPNNLSSCEVITSCSVMNSSANGCFGAAGANYTTDAFEFYYNGKVCNVGFGDTPLRYTSSVAINDILKININKNERTVFLNEQLLCTDVPATETFTCPATFILGALNRAGNIEYYSANKIYSCKLWDNGTLARDLIPCINPSNEVGMYDIVNNTFYGNSGTGTFTAGPTYKEITKLFYEGGN